MEKKDKYLILLYARDFNKGRGISYGEFFDVRPKSMEDLSINELSNIFDKELRINEGLLKPVDRGRYVLTEKGEKELTKYLKNAGNFRLFFLSKAVPEFGVNYRIKMIESFIGSILLASIFSLIIFSFQDWFDTHLSISFIVSTIILLFFVFSIFAGITIISNFIFGLTSNLSKSFGKFIEKNIFWILPTIIVLAIIGGLFALFKFTNLKLENFVGEIIFGAILYGLFNIKKISPKIENICNKIQKKIKSKGQ